MIAQAPGTKPQFPRAAAGLAMVCVAALLAEALRIGDTWIVLLVVTLAVAGALAMRTAGSETTDAASAPATAEIVPDCPEPPPTSLAFLDDPFAIPPPILADMHAVQPFVETLCGQIDGIQSDVADSVVSVVDRVSAIHLLSAEQRQRIGASLDGADAIRTAARLPGEIVARLEAMLAERDRMIETNFAGLQALAGEFQDLRATIDVISRMGDKAFFLSVNAAVEAHHQGSAGAAFGLIAHEMRSLASQTASGAREVGQSIHAFAERMHEQIAAAMPDRRKGADDLGGLIVELGHAQAMIADAGGDLDRVIQTLDAGHQSMVESLSEILGSLQFQDVMRQRLDQVFGALRALEELVERATSGAPPEQSLLDVIERQRQAYVMDSQRQVHNTVVDSTLFINNDTTPAQPRSIELF